MEDAGTVDLRGDVVAAAGARGDRQGRQRRRCERRGQDAEGVEQSGAHRRDKDANGVYDEADAVRIMDAWWPRWVEAQFKPKLGGKLFATLQDVIALHDAPGPGRLGVLLRLVRLRRQGPAHDPRAKVKGRFSRAYCGGGELAKCRKRAGQVALGGAAHTSDAELYPGEPCEGGDAQWCHDAVEHTATGAITQPPDPLDRPAHLPAGRPDRSASPLSFGLARVALASSAPMAWVETESLSFTARHETRRRGLRAAHARPARGPAAAARGALRRRAGRDHGRRPPLPGLARRRAPVPARRAARRRPGRAPLPRGLGDGLGAAHPQRRVHRPPRRRRGLARRAARHRRAPLRPDRDRRQQRPACRRRGGRASSPATCAGRG